MVLSSGTAWSCSLALVALVLVVATSASASDYPGVIELVGYSNRRARAYFQEEEPKAKPSPPSAKTRADIETVKRNIRKYDRLLELDTKNLPEQQKDMLARIVERVARLKESLDIEEQQFSQQEATSTRSSSTSTSSSSTSTTQQQQTEAETEQEQAEEQSTLPPTGSTETETDPTLLLDETTLLELQHTMNEQAALQAAVTQQTTLMKDLPTTTDFSQESAGTGTSDHNEEEETGETTSANLTTQPEMSQETDDSQSQEEDQAAASTTSDEALTDATDPDDQFVAARSNNNIAAITAADADPSSSSTTTTTATNAGSQQRTLTTMGKLKHRQATKRPFGHKVTTALKRGAQRPSSNSAAAASAAAASKPPSGSTTQKQKLSTNAAYQQKQQTKPLQTKVTPSIGASSSAPSSSSALPSATTNSANPGLPIEQLYTRTPQANIPLSAAAAAAAASSSAAAAGGAAAASTYSTQQQDSLVYDGHVNASALIDSLSTNAREEYYQQKLGSAVNNKDNKKTATAKPTKYHYYPHNQHIYLLPECAIQQVCNAVYVRLNYTQPLCACPSRYRDPCSASLNEDDQHTTKLVGDNKKKAITLAKTCEATTEMRECRSPKDWSLLALQNTRTGKSHYLVICRCPDHFKMEGPMAHDQPTYASVPGIRVFGMMCVKPGYSIRKPSSQPPKRYQLQKPFYRPSVGGSSSIGGQKDSYGRPIYGSGSSGSSSSGGSPISSNYQPQDQQSFQNGGPSSSYQYLNRPESTHSTHSSHSSSSANFRPDQFSINNFPGSNYGRNNERRGDLAPIEALGSGTGAGTGTEEQPGSSTPASEEARTTLQAQEQQQQLEQELEQESEPAAASPVTTLPEPALEGSTRIRRSLADTMDLDLEPEFPWDRVVEFQQSIVWD
ncbi:uncharacterized protein PB18E9.04c [Drosophila persimilis]|uniref:uncharacterized protein PB18E9.04c n=1 Tax=Drosophila persimilis TaxID=7234 RepID=UPI000F080491|nr:uncharacterized protein PB18E9.04c [Drosophila persimilis]